MKLQDFFRLALPLALAGIGGLAWLFSLHSDIARLEQALIDHEKLRGHPVTIEAMEDTHDRLVHVEAALAALERSGHLGAHQQH